jgi:dTDP-4-dehydrorhamnose 3,5-epimerase
MEAFKVTNTIFQGAYIISAFSSEDNRGYFVKDFEKEIFEQNGISVDVYETFESYSVKNVIRGLHFQTNHPQAKLIHVITGTIYDVIVDLREASETFGKWEGYLLSEENRQSLYIPKGFAHGYSVLSDSAILSYKCIGKYHKGSDSGIIWNDVDLNIDWKLNEEPIISERDKALMTFNEFTGTYKSLA